MHRESHDNRVDSTRVLHAYLLGRLDFAEMLNFQRRLVYDISGNRSAGALVCCEHAPIITLGRTASARHVLEQGTIPSQWVGRGGGCLLSVPGQISVYAAIALDAAGVNVYQYLERIHLLMRDVLRGFQIAAEIRPRQSGIWVGERLIAHVGVAVRDWVTSFGCTLNVDPDLRPFRLVQCDGHARPMTSVLREQRMRVRHSGLRQRIIEEFARQFDFERTAVFHHHPAISQKAFPHAVASLTR